MRKISVNSKFLVPGSLSVLTLIAIFFVSISSDNVTTQSVSDDYEKLCGYAVTDEMRLDMISKASFSSDSFPYLKGHSGNFSHVEKSVYLTDIPLIQYWFDLKNGNQVYFEMDVCNVDKSNITLGEVGPNYKKPEYTGFDTSKYIILPAPGSPLIYKDTLKPVLDLENCKRVADNYTKEERPKLFTRETTTFDAAWENQVFPLMDYCTGIGTYELKTRDGNINWSFTEK